MADPMKLPVVSGLLVHFNGKNFVDNRLPEGHRQALSAAYVVFLNRLMRQQKTIDKLKRDCGCT